MGATVERLMSEFKHFLDVFVYLTISYGGNFSQSLKRISLYIKTVNSDRPKKTVHDKVSLVFVQEIRSRTRHCPLKSLNCNLAKLDI